MFRKKRFDINTRGFLNTRGFDINTRGLYTRGLFRHKRGAFAIDAPPTIADRADRTCAMDAPPRNDERPFAMDAPPRNDERPFAMDAPPRNAERRDRGHHAIDEQCASTPSLRWFHGEEFKPTLALPKPNDYGCIHETASVALARCRH